MSITSYKIENCSCNFVKLINIKKGIYEKKLNMKLNGFIFYSITLIT